jgi:hypothetical protein
MPREDAQRPLSRQEKVEITDGLRKWHVVSQMNRGASDPPRRNIQHVTSLPQIPAIIEQGERLREMLNHRETRILRQIDEINAHIARLTEEREALSGSDRGRHTRRINVLNQQKQTLGAQLGFRDEPLETLSKVQGYRKFYPVGHSIIGQTHLIVMDGWILGRYEVEILATHVDHPYVHRLERMGHHDDYYWHPHIIKPDVICWGTFSSMRGRMEHNGDIPSVFALVIQYLGSWASYDCYCHLPHMEAYRGPA